MSTGQQPGPAQGPAQQQQQPGEPQAAPEFFKGEYRYGRSLPAPSAAIRLLHAAAAAAAAAAACPGPVGYDTCLPAYPALLGPRARDDLPDLPGYHVAHSLEGAHGGAAVTAVRFDRAGRRLASAGGDGSAAIWDADTGRLLHRLKGHAGGISGGWPGFVGADGRLRAATVPTPRPREGRK